MRLKKQLVNIDGCSSTDQTLEFASRISPIRVSQTSGPLEIYMIVNFRACGISRVRTS
jgi:hypothetical protein